jgi:hypothetical protein
MTADAFVAALISSDRAAGRAPLLPAAADLYGWLVGSWTLEVRHYAGVEVAALDLRGELHAGRVLEGRGVQDVWIMPPRGARAAALDPVRNMYGTTLRIWDSAIEAWRITWINPATNHTEQQIGRAHGNDIVQLGVRASGTATRWMFIEITPRSFRWLGDALEPDGKTWRREGEFVATRAPST